MAVALTKMAKQTSIITNFIAAGWLRSILEDLDRLTR